MDQDTRLRYSGHNNLNMMHAFFFSVIFIFASVTNRTVAEKYVCKSELGSNNEHCPNELDDIGCGLYLAESSILDSGLGLYTGVGVKKGESTGQDELPILISAINAHNEHKEEGMDPLSINYHWWETMTQGQFHAYGSYPTIPGIGMITNGHTTLVNIKTQKREYSTRMDRSKDPGAGAMTEWHKVSWIATENLEIGTELFLLYGDSFFDDPELNWGKIPSSSRVYDEANEIVDEFLYSFEGLAYEDKQGIWDISRNIASPLYRSLLPEDVMLLDEVNNLGTARYELPNSIRSLDWLEHNGQCMDNLVIKESLIPQAGRGAFAARFIAQGSLVVPAPLLHIHNKRILNMYKLTEWSDSDLRDEQVRVDDTIIGQQLLLNYCFGHRNSSLVLYPYTNAAFINHNSEPNAEIVWSNSSSHQNDWLDDPVENLSTTRTALIFDIIATKDVYPGDEIFINYGPEWELAWNNHVSNWTPVSGAHDYVHPGKMNENPTSMLKTSFEKLADPYPRNLRLACYYQYSIDDRIYDPTYARDVQDDSEATSRYDTNWEFDLLEEFDLFEELNLWPCEILNRYKKDEKYIYSVRVRNFPGLSDGQRIPAGEQHIIHQVPRTAIRFSDREYESNYHLMNAFRHPIGIPDNIFPAAWINA